MLIKLKKLEIFDIEEDYQRRKIISFLDSKDLNNLNKIDYKTTKTSSLNLEQNPEIKAVKKDGWTIDWNYLLTRMDLVF